MLDRRLTYAHSLKRVGGKLNLDSYQLFAPYFSGYRIWRSKGLEAMRCSLEEGESIVAVTMDVKSFYHSVSPSFVLRQSFLKRNGVQLNAEDIKFTELLLKSMATWHAASPEFQERPEGALPVGLSASKIISNILLAEFDRVMDSHPATIHYGRYADDIFLVMHADPAVHSGEQFVKWLRQQFSKIFILSRENGDLGLKLRLPYAVDSDIIFSSKKQKIFFLSGLHGLDLIGQIEEQIKRQSSEYRLLPELPVREEQMVDMALLATPDARLEADALRKAEAVSLRRLGFSFLLGDFESYSRDLHCEDPAWKTARNQFYGIVDRYLVTPSGFFDYFTHIIRVFGLMVACRDFSSAQQLLNSLDSVAEVLSATTSCGGVDSSSFRKALKSYYRGFLQVSLESATVSGFSISRQFMSLVRRLCGKLRRSEYYSKKDATHAAKRLLLSDLGRRSYQDYWYNEQVEDEEDQPPLPASYSVKKTLAWVRYFRDMAKRSLRAPYWPAIAFPTRPPLPWQISLSIPKALEKKGGLEKLMWAVRGGHINPNYSSYRFLQLDESRRRVWKVPSAQGLNVALALPSFKVTFDQWRQAVSGAPDHSMDRYIAVRRLINEMMSCAEKIDYIVFPELSVPYRWAVDIAARLARSGISFIAGIETRGHGKEYKNDVLVSLVSNFYGKKSNICFVQSKIALS